MNFNCHAFSMMNTALPSNLRPTTRECVHLVTRDQFRSRDKMAFTPFDQPDANLMALCFIEPELLPIEV